MQSIYLPAQQILELPPLGLILGAGGGGGAVLGNLVAILQYYDIVCPPSPPLPPLPSPLTLSIRDHYTEYLVTKINKAPLDPISLYAVNNMEAMLTREEQPPLEKGDDDEATYKEKLIKVGASDHLSAMLRLHVCLYAQAY